ncbi:MAG: sigma 54-interacting transcriptional regulator [Pseudomonadota bacterium]
MVIREIASGETITDQNNDQNNILCLLSGKAEVVVGYSAAQEVILEQVLPGDVFGDLAFLTGRPWPSDAKLVALDQSKALEIPIEAFQRVLRENPEFTISLLKSLGKKIVSVDRSDFASPSKTDGSDSSAVCNYPLHPGLPEEVQSVFRKLALSNDSVLIVGENGVGKEILAYAIFDAAETNREVLVPLDVIRIKPNALVFGKEAAKDSGHHSSTIDQLRFLFGHENQTEHSSNKIGLGFIELAQNGALFIRGAHRLTPVAQQKLLDALKTGYYCPTGGTNLVHVNFRLICTTTLDPQRYDLDHHPLLYELRNSALVIPPLRDRRSFIPALAHHYLEHYSKEMKRKTPKLEDLTLRAMIDYSWPGNDLELANAMRRSVLVSPGGVVRRQDLTLESRRSDTKARYNLLKLRPVKQALMSPLFPAILQSAFLPIFLGIVLMLFLGPPDPSRNLGSLIMWSLAWPGVIIGAFFGARISCSVCAIGALSNLAKRILALEIPFPEVLKRRSDFLIAGGILFIIWLECVTDIRSSPFNLGLLLLTMFVLAFVLNTVWSRQAWCRYLCPLGGMTGLMARTSILELRADHEVCLSNCTTQDCYVGAERAEGCPFSQVVATLHSNQFCKICGSCVKNCSHDAIKLNLRLPGYELGEVRYVRTGTGFLVLGLMGGLLADTLTRMPFYNGMSAYVAQGMKFTVLFVGSITAVNLIFMSAVLVSHKFYREKFSENYSRFALAMLPLTCMMFLAFHVYYLLTLGPQMVALVSQYFGGYDTVTSHIIQIPNKLILLAQVVLIILGLIWTLITAYRVGLSTPRGKYARRIGIIPHAAFSVLVAFTFVRVIKTAFGL